MEWEVVFGDGSEYIVEADNKEDAIFEAEDKYCYNNEPLQGFHSKELIDEFEIPKIKSCNMV